MPQFFVLFRSIYTFLGLPIPVNIKIRAFEEASPKMGSVTHQTPETASNPAFGLPEFFPMVNLWPLLAVNFQLLVAIRLAGKR